MNKSKRISGISKFLKHSSFKSKATIVFFGMVVLFLVLAPVSLALETGIEYGTATGLGTQDIRVSIMKIVRIILGFVGIIALLITLYAGYIWMTSAGNAEKIDQAKKTLRNAAIGLVIILLAFAIVSFIIGVLQDIFGTGTGPGGRPPACSNCGQLGRGVLESVYPAPYSRDVARNTNVMITFKIEMDPSSIILDESGDGVYGNCSGSPVVCDTVDDNSILIYVAENGSGNKLPSDQVLAVTNDNKTFVFNPLPLLGNSSTNTWYETHLSNQIKKDNGTPAFTGIDGDSFTWSYEIGTYVDLDTPEVDNIFPQPDDESDDYDFSPAAAATGPLKINAVPKFAQVASTGSVIESGGAPLATISGGYNCAVDTYLCINYHDPDGGGPLALDYYTHPKSGLDTDCSGVDIFVPGLVTNPDQLNLNNQSLSIGCGVTLSFNGTPIEGNRWEFLAKANKTADTLKIGSTLFTFVEDNPTSNQIVSVTGNILVTVGNIFNAINANSEVIAVVDPVDTTKLNLTAAIAGVAGNSLSLLASGPWATANPTSGHLQGGVDLELNPVTKDIPDKPRNAVITIDFNEAINPVEINKDTIKIEYDATGAGGWTTVDGAYLVSNQYRTVEFLSNNNCEVGGVPVQNSCGDPIFCLPVMDPDPIPYRATNYRITVLAGALRQCGGPSDCLDSNFSSCEEITPGGQFACRSLALDVFYPEADFAGANGITDSANNSFSANYNSYTTTGEIFGEADAPASQNNQDPYNANAHIFKEPDDSQGDDLVWSFYINKSIKISPPLIETTGPEISDPNASVIEPINSDFDVLLQSSTLKPGSNYRDGLCHCTSDSQCNATAGEYCDTTRLKCVNDNPAAQEFCADDNECTTLRCDNKKYLSLIDQSSQPAAWWVSKAGIDLPPKDGYDDKNSGLLNHTPLVEAFIYGSEDGSGIKDIYQNCFLPSEGPGFPSGACGTSTISPYCCNGQPMDQPAWQASICYTGF